MKNVNCISKKSTIKEAISKLDEVENKLLIVLDLCNKVMGTVTDGDIRRGILCGVKLDSSISNVMNKNPILLQKNDSKSVMITKMEEELVFYVPLVDCENRFIDLLSLNDLKKNIYTNYSVFILAGGLGSRLKELTKDIPKPMLPINGKPMLERLILSFKNQGFSDFYLSVNYLKEKIINYFGDGSAFGVNIKYVEEQKRLGTAGPLSLLDLKGLVDKGLIIINSDVCINADFRSLIRYHIKNKNEMTVCAKEHEYQIPYGVIRFEDDSLINIDEKPVSSYFVSAGIYLIDKQLLALLDRNIYFDMPDYINKVKKHNCKVGIYPLHEQWVDIGVPEEYEKVT